jgi:molybdenum cofactor cytidylyltransferase
MNAPQIGVLVMAAGLSSRLNGPNKLLALWRGKPLVAHSIVKQRAIVLHRDRDLVVALLEEPADWIILENDRPQKGFSSSLQLGLRALQDCDAVLVMLGDMPDVSPGTLHGLVQSWHSNTFAVVPRFKDQWGNPVLLGRDAMDACSGLTGDQGAKKLLLARQQGVMLLDTLDPNILRDFDHEQDFS